MEGEGQSFIANHCFLCKAPIHIQLSTQKPWPYYQPCKLNKCTTCTGHLLYTSGPQPQSRIQSNTPTNPSQTVFIPHTEQWAAKRSEEVRPVVGLDANFSLENRTEKPHSAVQEANALENHSVKKMVPTARCGWVQTLVRFLLIPCLCRPKCSSVEEETKAYILQVS